MKTEKFYMIIRKTGGSAPAKRHNTFEEASEEATRLCRQSLEPYYILEATFVVEPKEPPVVFRGIE